MESGLQMIRRGDTVELDWNNLTGRDAAQVNLFLADSGQTVLAVQTVMAPPYRALFAPVEGTTYVGVTAVWGDGSVSTALLPYSD